MSIALWNELQQLKARMESVEALLSVKPPQPDALANMIARLEALELARKGKR